MIYLQYVSKEEKRRFVSQPTVRLLGIYFLIDLTTKGYISDELRYGIALIILLIVLIFSKINVLLKTIEKVDFEVSSRDGILIFKRFGECVFEIEISRVESVWYAPHKYLRNKLFIELDDHQRHSFKLPLFVDKKTNYIGKLVDELSDSVYT